MPKRFTVAVSILFLLSACISIKQNASMPTQQHFVTATLAPTTVNRMPVTTAIPADTEVPGTVMTVHPNCTNGAILLRDVTIPDYTQVKAGETFTKTWEFQNTGTCPWMGYTLKFTSGDDIHAPLSTPMSDAAPKEKVQVSMELTAPTSDGSYSGYFSLFDVNGTVIPVGTEKAFWVKFMVGTYVAAPAVSGTSSGQTGNCIHSQNVGYVNEIFSLINAARAEAGLPALAVNAQLATFAQSHAEDMAFNNFLSHDGSNASFSERMRSYGVFGEILAIGTPQDAMDQWQRDEHWDFVLGGGTQIGAGYAYNSCSDYGGYFTVDFQ